jgi:hypothetical protein
MCAASSALDIVPSRRRWRTAESYRGVCSALKAACSIAAAATGGGTSASKNGWLFCRGSSVFATFPSILRLERDLKHAASSPEFDAFLARRGVALCATVIGGAALQLLGVIARPTKDCDAGPLLNQPGATAHVA